MIYLKPDEREKNVHTRKTRRMYSRQGVTTTTRKTNRGKERATKRKKNHFVYSLDSSLKINKLLTNCAQFCMYNKFNVHVYDNGFGHC